MTWPTAPLGVVAPAVPSARQFRPDQEIWQLNLDQIENYSGRITSKQRASVVHTSASTLLFDEGNVLYSKVRPHLNKVAHPDEPGIATTELVPLRPRPEVLRPGFLKFYLLSDHFLAFANQVVEGAKTPRMNMHKFWEHQIPLPTLHEQRRIEEILEQADTLRQKRTEANALADRILPTLFHKIFGDPSSNPKNLRRTTLGNVIMEAAYGTPSTSNSDSHGIPVLRMNNITVNGSLTLDDLNYAELDPENVNRYRLEAGDLLFNRTNSRELVGKTGLWHGQKEAVAAHQVIRVRVDRQQVFPEFVWAWLNTSFIKQQLFEMVRGALGMANIDVTGLSSLPILLPDLSLQRTFKQFFEDLSVDNARRRLSRSHLEMLFKTILHRAFTGELTAKWRETDVEELLAEDYQKAKSLNLPTNGIN